MTTVTYYPATHDGAAVSTYASNPIKTSGFDPAIHRFPSFMSTVFTRAKLDLITFVRDRESLLFVIAFPLTFLALFSLMAGAEAMVHPENPEIYVTMGTTLLPGLIAFGMMLSSWQSLAASISHEREKGGLKRLQATPLTPAAYFGGKVVMILVTSLIQIALLLGLGVAFFNVTLPTAPTAWLNFGWLWLLGTAAGTVLGIATSRIGKTAKATSAVVTGFLTALAFLSGVFGVGTNFPIWVSRIAQVFPLYWLASGMRTVFLPQEIYTLMAHGSVPNLGLGAAILGAWAVVGLVLVIRTFLWNPRR
jgi:ABC-2 type transport system permease protein